MARLVRVELECHPNANDSERWVAFKKLWTKFEKVRFEAGIKKEIREREAYESPGQKRRRKKKESNAARLESKLRENFPKKKKKKDKERQ